VAPDFLHVASFITACAVFSKESRMRLVIAIKLNRKSGGTGVFAGVDPLIRSALNSDRKWTLSILQCPVVGVRSN
jgi:hypothetical protein